MMQTIEFVNATLENTWSVGSIDIFTTIFSIVAVVIAGLTFWFTLLRGMSISSHAEHELPELSKADFERDVPTELPVKVTLSVLNSGNRAGIVKDLELKFNPQSDFKEFYRDMDVKWYSIRSAKTNQPLDSTILIKDRDTDLVIFDVCIHLDRRISRWHHLRTLDTESENLKTLLKEILKSKEKMLRNFINFLKKNEKLGDIIISYSYTTEKLRRKYIVLPSIYIELKKETLEPLEVTHSYKKTIECYEDSLENYRLHSLPKKIIGWVSREIEELKYVFDFCYDNAKTHSENDFFHFELPDRINGILKKENEEIELLSKCRNYRETIEKDVKPLLDALLRFNRNVRDADEAPTETLRQSLNEEIKEEKEKLMEKLKKISPKLEELKKEVEHELS